MRICFIATLVVGAAWAAPNTATVVRADPRTGRLVRRVVVPSKVVAARSVPSRPAAAPARVAKQPLKGNLNEIVNQAAQSNNLDPLLVHSVIQVESNYNPYAISHRGAEGMMQLMPSTARRLGVRNSFDARENIEGGVRYLKYLKERFQDDRLALAAYNAGEGAVDRYRWIPPYAETQQYVYKVGKKLGELRREAAQQPAQKPVAGPVPAVAAPAPAYRAVESRVDSEGKLHLRTR